MCQRYTYLNVQFREKNFTQNRHISELMVYWQTVAEEYHLNCSDESERWNDNYVGQTKAASVSSYGLSQSVASGIGGGMTGSNMGVSR